MVQTENHTFPPQNRPIFYTFPIFVSFSVARCEKVTVSIIVALGYGSLCVLIMRRGFVRNSYEM